MRRGVQLSDLPAHVRKRIAGQLDPAAAKLLRGASSSRSRGRAKGGRAEDLGAPCPGTCVSCGERFPSALRWQQHADSTGCSIWSIDGIGERS